MSSGEVHLPKFSKVPTLVLGPVSSSSRAANHHGCGQPDAMTLPTPGWKMEKVARGGSKELAVGDSG